MEESDDEDKWDQLDAKNWERIKASRRTDGYREGLSAGKESSRQEGFNKGYSVGLSVMKSTGKLKGKIWAIMKLIECNNEITVDKTKALLRLRDSIAELKEINNISLRDICDKNDIETEAQEVITEKQLDNIVKACKSTVAMLNIKHNFSNVLDLE